MSSSTAVRYSKSHEWARDEGDGTFTVGITDFAQSKLGDIVYVGLETKSDTLSVGDRFGSIDSTKSSSDLYAPVSGTVVGRNAELDAAPELVNSDPQGGGWMIRVSADSSQDFMALMDEDAYGVHCAAEH